MKRKTGGEFLLLAAPTVYLVVAVVMTLTVCRNGVYPSGSDMMYHLYRGQRVYAALKDGVLWPGLDWLMYNGVELLRWTSPASAYGAALGIWLAGGDVLGGYLVLIGLLYCLNAVSWLLVGRTWGRPRMGAFLGLIWFFLPFNLYMLFAVGDLGYAMGAALLSPLISLCCQFVSRPKWTRLPEIALCSALFTLCSVECAGMVLPGLALLLLVLGLWSRRWREGLLALLAAGAGLAATGVWLCACVLGKTGGSPTVQAADSLWAAFNPLLCLASGGAVPYLGLAALALGLLGGLGAPRPALPIFWAGIALFLCACLLPGTISWLSLASLALCLVFLGLLSWPTLRRPLAALVCLLLCLDILPGWTLVAGTQSGELAGDRLDALQSSALIDLAQQEDLQRIALLDGGALESTGAFLLSGWNGTAAAMLGWAWESAETAEQISQIDQAMGDGCYLYVFDRCMELGSDGVLIAVAQLQKGAEDISLLDQAAQSVGFTLSASNDAYLLYTLPTQGSWGLLTEYPAIAIGDSADLAAPYFPALEETSSPNLNDYTFEQLSAYQVVYLSGFTYNDREQAEELVLRLSRAGVRVVIDAHGLPADQARQQSFLGVTCSPITFSGCYPALETETGFLYTGAFPQDSWQTVFLNGLEDCWGQLEADGMTVEICGTVDNENLVFVGLNLPYFYELTGDEAAGQLLTRLLGLEADALPRRTLVSLQVEYGFDGVTITSPADGVNTTLAYHSGFQSDRDIQAWNNLLVVQQGTTAVTLRYSYLWPGLAVSAAGLLLIAALCLYARRLYPRVGSSNGEKREEQGQVTP